MIRNRGVRSYTLREDKQTFYFKGQSVVPQIFSLYVHVIVEVAFVNEHLIGKT